MKHLATLLEVVGIAAVVVGSYLFDWRAGVVVAGLALILFGAALDRPSPRAPE